MKKNIHILPTDQPSSLGYHFDKVSSLNSVDYAPNFGFDEFNTKNNYQHRPYHLYITSDEEIKVGDWYLVNQYGNGLLLATQCATAEDIKYQHKFECKKIILTTDKTLIADGVQAIDDKFLEWFVENPTCEFVEVEQIKIFDGFLDPQYGSPKYKLHYKIIIPKEEPKMIECYFIPSNNTSSATICRNCGKEKFLHTIGSGIKVSKSVIITQAEPKQETLEEVAKKYAELSYYNGDEVNAFVKGVKWQDKRSYSEEDMIAIVEKSRETGLTAECLLLFEQFKKK